MQIFLRTQEAERAIQCLNGKLALSKKLVVRWAHAQVTVSLKAISDCKPQINLNSESRL